MQNDVTIVAVALTLAAVQRKKDWEYPLHKKKDASMVHDTILSKALIGSNALLWKVLLVILGSIAVAVSARVDVPMYPVPMSLQTLAISIIGLTYGARLAGITLLAYLAEGLVGLPVFAGGGVGLGHLMGPTGGYLFGFVAMAWLTGWMIERANSRSLLMLLAAAFIPALLLFVPGVLWLWAATSLDFSGSFMAGCFPFLIGGFVKSLLAALVVSGIWKALEGFLNKAE